MADTLKTTIIGRTVFNENKRFDSFSPGMVKIGDIDPADKKFWPDEPEPGFSPRRNKAVIERTIKKYEKKQMEKRKEAWEGIRERADAVAYWLTSEHGAKSGKSLVKYFGRRYLAKLRGDRLMDRIKAKMRVIQHPFANLKLRNKIITGKGTHKIHGSQVKKGDKKE